MCDVLACVCDGADVLGDGVREGAADVATAALLAVPVPAPNRVRDDVLAQLKPKEHPPAHEEGCKP